MAIVSYMGTKSAFASDITASFVTLSAGPLLDLFAGMAAVGQEVPVTRNVWLNDVQAFSTLTSKVRFQNCNAYQYRRSCYKAALSFYSTYNRQLLDENLDLVHKEETSLKQGSYAALLASEALLCEARQRNLEEGAGHAAAAAGDYKLFTLCYAGTYVGIGQAIEIDSIRAAIDSTAPAASVSLSGVRRWMLAALGAAVSRCSNSTGHFAQYLTPNSGNFQRVISKRRRSVLDEWKKRLRHSAQIGNYRWRSGNRVFSSDACTLLESLKATCIKPGVIYADPPYTSDQYSRYYHLLETLVSYDYPQLSGKGLYPFNRFVSDWSLKRKVALSFETLINRSQELGSDLVISYPTNGLLENSAEVIPEMMGALYSKVEVMQFTNHRHSTLGGSKGSQKTSVTEQLFIGSNPRRSGH